MKKVTQKYSIRNNVMYLFRVIAATNPLLFVMILMEIVLSFVSPVVGIYFPSLAVKLVTEQVDLPSLIFRLGGLGLLLACSMGLIGMAQEGKYMLINNLRPYFQKKLFFHSLHCDYIHVESKEGQTKYQCAMDSLAQGDWSGTTRMVMATMALLTNVFCFVIYSGILTTLHPLVSVMLVLLSLLNLFMNKKAQIYEHSRKNEKAGLNQKLGYIERIARDANYGKDIRLYNMSSWFVHMRNSLTDAYCNLENQIKNRFFWVSCMSHLTLFLRDGLAYGYLIYSVMNRNVSVSDFVLYFGAITGFSNFVQNMIAQYNTLQAANLQMNDMRAFLDTTDAPEPENPASIPKGSCFSIDFDHVWFFYDESKEAVLKDFSLHIEAGEKIALVGVNGAGKTTLIKLLCGFYRPDKGEIRINGIDINRFRREDLFELFSAVFQDIYIAPHTVAENVSMTMEEETDKERVEACLKKVGIWDVIKSYPDGMHSYMTKAVHDGILLSGGQQQKLLMARALYKDAPVMILDEPTAALDPIAENETYESFRRLTGDKTVIYISHRLASTRFCDRIVLLKHGKVAETGSHDALMKQNGGYAEMFEIQSHYYQDGGDNCEDMQTMETCN